MIMQINDGGHKLTQIIVGCDGGVEVSKAFDTMAGGLCRKTDIGLSHKQVM
jgi:hypothetical protein